MKNFLEYLSEEVEPKGKPLRHLEHVEDKVIHGGGHEAIAEADNHLHAVHNTLLGKKAPVSISTKWDGCIHANTEVLLYDHYGYKTETIKKLTSKWNLGDNTCVIGMNENNEVVVTQILDKNITSVPKQWLKVEFDNNSYIIVTDDHKIFTDKGEIEAKDLTFDHEIINIELN